MRLHARTHAQRRHAHTQSRDRQTEKTEQRQSDRTEQRRRKNTHTHTKKQEQQSNRLGQPTVISNPVTGVMTSFEEHVPVPRSCTCYKGILSLTLKQGLAW